MGAIHHAARYVLLALILLSISAGLGSCRRARVEVSGSSAFHSSGSDDHFEDRGDDAFFDDGGFEDDFGDSGFDSGFEDDFDDFDDFDF